MLKKAVAVESPSPSSEPSPPIASSICWDCKSEVGGTYHCQQCVKVQPLSKEGDYFEYFGIPRILNFDLEDLESRYYTLSRKFHPDFFENKSPMGQSISLGNSAVLNTAYQTLKDPTRRIHYLLELEAGTRKPLPATPPESLFEELMEVQDDIIAFKQSSNPHSEENLPVCDRLDASKALLEDQHKDFSLRLQTLALDWDSLVSNQTASKTKGISKESLLKKMRKLISDQSYVSRILNDINALRSIR